MKKYLLIGLIILVGTNLAALSGVAYNRMGEAIAQLTLTERELSLPYNSGVQKENSGVALSIKWRTSTANNETDYLYNSRDIQITKDELLALGFNHSDIKNNYWVESRELYWAFEFDGDRHKTEIKKAESKYQTAVVSFKENPSEANSSKKKEYRESLEREKTTNSRLFYIEASTDYELLANKFSGKQNILIVRGLTKPYYDNHYNVYRLQLKHLSVRNIMIPLEFVEVLSKLKRVDKQDITPPRYAVDISWGNRLEPWVVNVNGLTD